MSISISKEYFNRGFKKAQLGKLENAIRLFSQASSASFHIEKMSLRVKIGMETLIMLNLCKAVKSVNDKDYNAGKNSFSTFKNYLTLYENHFKDNHNESERIKCQQVMAQVKVLTNKYEAQVNLMKADKIDSVKE